MLRALRGAVIASRPCGRAKSGGGEVYPGDANRGKRDRHVIATVR